MRHFILPLVLFFQAAPAFTAPPAIKVMTFNIRYDGSPRVPSSKKDAWLSTSGKDRRDLALQVIRDYDPDLLGVQEGLVNQIEDIQKTLSKHSFYGVGRDDGEKQGEYCGIYYRGSRFTKLKGGTFWLNEDADQPGTRFPKTCCARIASWVILRDTRADNQEYLVLNSHWDHQIQAAREFSAKLIQQRLSALAGDRPVLLVGDLNAQPDNPALTDLLNRGPTKGIELFDSFAELHPQTDKNVGTFHGFRGKSDGARIDYILHSKGFRPQAVQIVHTHEEDRYPSDHFPVTATLIPTKVK